MADMAKFNKTVEKLCIDCAGDVGKLLASCRRAIIDRTDKLANDITKVEVPDASPADLAKVPAQVSTILKRESSHFANVLILTAAVRIDVPARKLSVVASGVSGPMASI